MPIFPVQSGQKHSSRKILAALILHTELTSGVTSQISNTAPSLRYMLAEPMATALKVRLQEIEDLVGD